GDEAAADEAAADEAAADEAAADEAAGDDPADDALPADAPPVRADWAPETMVVGIGASAGGLAALRQLFRAMPGDSGLAFVIVMHLSPEHESHLADLLQQYSLMPVLQVTRTLPVEPDHVYVIPPGRNLSALDSHLRLSALEAERRERAPIDHFFRTLAETHERKAIGLVLTGTGSDGTLGIKHVKERGGLTLVQDPNEAEYDGMPQSAIATGIIDLVLPLAEMPEQILAYARIRPHVRVPGDGEDLDEAERAVLLKIFAQVRARTGRDFSLYKRSTLMRRIARRMQLQRIEELPAYLDRLREDTAEVKALSDEFLITVTNFFRDDEVFTRLEHEIIPQLFAEKRSGDAVRVWSVGCATGEEAYSLAMLLLEAAGRRSDSPQVQVFASDLHEQSLQRAREGFYPDTIEADVSRARLDRFFRVEDDGYRISKEVREVVVFAPHNLLSDPPFSKLDLIACRNVLIYLQREAQRDVIELFHYALNPEGYLLLGTSETVDRGDLFRTHDKRACLFRRRNTPRPEPRLPVFPLVLTRRPGGSAPVVESSMPASYGALHQQIVEQYAPPSVLVNEDYNIVHLSAHAGRYLALPGGELTPNIFRLVREPLRIELRAALHAAREKGEVSRSKPITVELDGEPHNVVLRVQPALEPERQGFILVVFDDAGRCGPEDSAETRDDVNAREREAELALLKQRLQAVIEEYETTQEEMKAANEELQSTNEELRSTMEELETSKEELQSMNEELTTLNQENRHKVEELSQLSGDLQNLLSATDIATLFLDRHLRIMRFTPQIGRLFNVRLADRGRPLSDLTHRLGYKGLIDDARHVLERLVPIEREVQDDDGRWYLTRVLPYRTPDDRIEGVVITFIDISSRRRTEAALRESQDELAGELRGSRRLHRMGIEGAGAHTRHEALDLVLRTLVEMQIADAAVIYLVEDGTHEPIEVAQLGFDATMRAALVDVRLADLPYRRALAAGQRLSIADVEVEAAPAAFRRAALAAGLRAVHAIPLVRRGDEAFGVICCWFREQHMLGERDARLLDLLARQAADLVDRLRVEAWLRQANETLELRVADRTAALHASEQKFRALIDASAQCVWTTDANGAVVEDSPSWRAFTGQSLAEWLDEGWAGAVHPEDRARALAAWEAAIIHREPFDDESRLRHREGGWRWTHIRAVPLRDASGAVHGWVAMNIDIAEKKQAEQDREQLMREVTIAEQSERRRISQVLHDELQQLLYAVEVKMKMARDALARRGDAGVSEIEDATTWVAQAIETTRQLTVSLSPPILKMEGLADALGWLQRQMLDLHGLDVHIEQAERVQIPDADLRVLLFQAVRELLFNVIKHAGVNEATVSLVGDAESCRITVSDGGAGFDVGVMHSAGKRSTHFGLNSIAERLRLVGGRLELESSPGGGTRAVIHAPLRLTAG
ncbi:MAG: CheR family methyltransferase, partial [bacterium]